jgi:hypothetical protein
MLLVIVIVALFATRKRVCAAPRRWQNAIHTLRASELALEAHESA